MSIIKDLKVLANRVFASYPSSAYTENELVNMHQFLSAQGYVKTGIYADEEKFKHVLHDYVRFGKNGEVLGIVILHLDADGRHGGVQDGIVEISKDKALIAKVGRTTSVADFVRSMNPTTVQKITSKLLKGKE